MMGILRSKKVFYFLFVLLSNYSILHAAVLDLHKIKYPRQRGAVCNDGTPAKYYYKPGIGNDSDKWIIHLKGGSSCVTEAECEDRWNADMASIASKESHRMTSYFYPQTKTLGGIFHDSVTAPTRNNQFENWNMIYLMYCSSDGHAGNGDYTFPSGKIIKFRGHRIVKSLIQDLKRDKGLRDASKVLFSGSSAGGAGVIANYEMVRNMIPSADVLAGLDSIYISDPLEYIGSLVAPSLTLDMVLEARAGIWNAKYSTSCLALYSNDPNKRGICSNAKNIVDILGYDNFFNFIDRKDNLFTGNAAAAGLNFFELLNFQNIHHQEILDLSNDSTVFSTQGAQANGTQGLTGPHVSFTKDWIFYDTVIGGDSLHDYLYDWVTAIGGYFPPKLQ